MKIYTKTGDAGDTGLFRGPRVRKDHPRIEAYGTVDELNAVIGVALAERLPPEAHRILAEVQHWLFDVGAELATPDPTVSGTATLGKVEIERLERAIDHFEVGLAELRQFILPGGCRGAAQLHLARTICRRAERQLVTLSHTEGQSIRSEPLVFLNRLGDLLFVLARSVNAAAGEHDVAWLQKPDRA